MTLTLYTNPMSRGRTARWMLEEIGQPYEVKVLAYGPAMKSPDFLALNPMGKVPVLVHDGGVIAECAAICCWLADRFPEAGLMPEDRGAFYRWMFFAAGPVEAAVTNRSLGVTVPAEQKGMVGYGDYDDVIHTLKTHLGRNGYFVGGSFSAADVYAGSQVAWGLRFGSIPAEPEFSAYADRILSRPAALRAGAADDALMAGAG